MPHQSRHPEGYFDQNPYYPHQPPLPTLTVARQPLRNLASQVAAGSRGLDSSFYQCVEDANTWKLLDACWRFWCSGSSPGRRPTCFRPWWTRRSPPRYCLTRLICRLRQTPSTVNPATIYQLYSWNPGQIWWLPIFQWLEVSYPHWCHSH